MNKEAAMELQANRRVFEQNVQKTMKGNCSKIIMFIVAYFIYPGGTLNGVYFERCLK